MSRRFGELALLWRLRDSLRSGDVWVQGSRRYADPETYLLDRASWAAKRTDYCAAVGCSRAGRERVGRLADELDEEAATFATMLEQGEGPVRIDGDHLIVGRDTGDDLPVSVKRVKAHGSSLSGEADGGSTGLEEDASAVVAQPGPPGVRTDVGRPRAAGRHGAAGWTEQWAAGAARPVGETQEPRQQVGGARAPVHPLGLAALGADGRSKFSRSSASTLRAKTSLARAAVS